MCTHTNTSWMGYTNSNRPYTTRKYGREKKNGQKPSKITNIVVVEKTHRRCYSVVCILIREMMMCVYTFVYIPPKTVIHHPIASSSHRIICPLFLCWNWFSLCFPYGYINMRNMFPCFATTGRSGLWPQSSAMTNVWYGFPKLL